MLFHIMLSCPFLGIAFGSLFVYARNRHPAQPSRFFMLIYVLLENLYHGITSFTIHSHNTTPAGVWCSTISVINRTPKPRLNDARTTHTNTRTHPAQRIIIQSAQIATQSLPHPSSLSSPCPPGIRCELIALSYLNVTI